MVEGEAVEPEDAAVGGKFCVWVAVGDGGGADHGDRWVRRVDGLRDEAEICGACGGGHPGVEVRLDVG